MKRHLYLFIIVLLLGFFANVHAQDSTALHRHITTLSSRTYFGRGYVGKGMQKAGNYIKEQFESYGVLPLQEDYFQPFTYAVNTFPSVVDVKFNGITLPVAEAYLVHPTSAGISIENKKVKVVNGMDFVQMIKPKKGITAEQALDKWIKTFPNKKQVVLLEQIDTVKKIMQWRSNKDLVLKLPKGLYLTRRKGKPIWPVSQLSGDATFIELYDSTLLFNKKTRIDATVINKFEPKFKASNITGIIKGTTQPDSFIVFTAHYDHIGKMGAKAMFPGANDNASGTAMLLELAKHYAQNPGKYSMVFLAFAGEEAGLLGSQHFVKNPKVDLSQIKFLVNLDMVGDATKGISVVNGEKHPEAHAHLVELNNRLPTPLAEIRKGGAAANSDHHHFSEQGVPAIFIFSMGGKGWYHDVWDKADQITLKNIPELGLLLKQFVTVLEEE